MPISTPPQQHNQYAPPAPASAQARPPTPPQPPDSLRTGFWTTTGGADWTDLELMPPDCALTGGYAPVSGDPPQTAPGLCASDQELPMAEKSRQGRFRCLKIRIQVFVTVFASSVTDNYGNRWQLLTCQWTTISGLCWLRSARWVSALACTPTAHIQRAMRN